MTDITQSQTVVPSIWQRLLNDYADKAVVAIGTGLIGLGAVSPDGWAKAGPIIAGIVVWGVNAAVAWISAHAKDLRLRKAVIAPSSTPVTK